MEEVSTSQAPPSGPPDSWQQHFYPHVLPQNGSMLSFLHGVGPSVSLGWCLAPEGFSAPVPDDPSSYVSEPNTPRTPGGTRYSPRSPRSELRSAWIGLESASRALAKPLGRHMQGVVSPRHACHTSL